jgi:hypothetical protein
MAWPARSRQAKKLDARQIARGGRKGEQSERMVNGREEEPVP